MSTRSTSLLTLSFALFACAPGDPGPAPRADGPSPAPVVAAPGAEAPRGPAPPAADDAAPARAIIYNVNIAFVTDDPGSALEQAESMLRKLGGEVTYASANGDNANLNGKVPIDARHRLRDALAKLEGSMQSENLSTSDVGHEVRRLQRRLAALQQANTQVASMFTGQQDPTQVEAAALLRELTDRERQSLEAQLESYRTQTRDAQVNVSFTRPPR